MLVEFMFEGIMCCKRPSGQFRANKKKGGLVPHHAKHRRYNPSVCPHHQALMSQHNIHLRNVLRRQKLQGL